MEIKRRYYVSNTAEGGIYGTIWLTYKQAKIVEFATNPANWSDIHDDGYGGSFSILDADAEDEIQECDYSNPPRLCSQCPYEDQCMNHTIPYIDDRSSLKTLFDEAREYKYRDSDSCQEIYTMIECMDDPLFIETVNQCRDGVIPDNTDVIDMIVEIVLAIMIYFCNSHEDRDIDVRNRAKEVAVILKPLFPKYNWDWISEKYGI